MRLPVPPPRHDERKKYGGGTQNRTGDEGFADLCLTAWLCRHIMERKTRLELATPTLARWCSTTELLPHWWCSGTELNRRHGDFQSPALPTELPEQNMATPIGFEPTIFAVTGRHVKPLHHGAVSYLSEPLAFRQKVFYHVPLVLASPFFHFFYNLPITFPELLWPPVSGEKNPLPGQGQGTCIPYYFA